MSGITGAKPITPAFDDQFWPPRDRVVAVIEAEPGQPIEAAREDFSRVLGLTGRVNCLLAELGAAASDPDASMLAKTHIQLALLVEFAERSAGGQVEAHAPLRQLLAELQEKLRAGS